MKLSQVALLKGAGWTIGAYVIGQILRFLTNLALTRLLAPEIFGVMAIVNSVKTGIDLVTDIGVETNVVHNPNARKSEFYNSAWSLQIIRGVSLWMVCVAAGFPLAILFGAPILQTLIPVAGLYLLASGFVSVGRFLAQKDLKFSKINVFELTVEAFGSAIFIIFAIFSPTVWALIFGGLVGGFGRTVASYFVEPGIRHRFQISKRYAYEILGFGKWIFLSSIVYFFSMSFDRLYLGKVAPLATLGVYGVARALSEPFGALIVRLGNYVVFPTIASSFNQPRSEIRRRLVSVRFGFLLFVVAGLALFASTADLVVSAIYDHRYQAVGWMLPILIVGTWFSIVSSLNEAVILGLGRPTFSALSNGVKLVYILIALPLGFAFYGMVGAVIAVAASDLWRYFPMQAGLFRERVSFARQDILLTIVLVLLIGMLQWIRWTIGLDTSFGELLHAMI